MQKKIPQLLSTHPWADHAKLIAVWDGNPGLNLSLGGHIDLHPTRENLLAHIFLLSLPTKLKRSLDPHEVGKASTFVVLKSFADHLIGHT